MEVVGVDRTRRKFPDGGGERLAADPLDAPTAHAVAEVLQLGPDVRGVIHDGSLRWSHSERERHQPCDQAFARQCAPVFGNVTRGHTKWTRSGGAAKCFRRADTG